MNKDMKSMKEKMKDKGSVSDMVMRVKKRLEMVRWP